MDHAEGYKLDDSGKTLLIPIFWFNFLATMLLASLDGAWFWGIALGGVLAVLPFLFMKEKLRKAYSYDILSLYFAFSGLVLLAFGNWLPVFHITFLIGGIALLFLPYGRHGWVYLLTVAALEFGLLVFDLSSELSVFAIGGLSTYWAFSAVLILLVISLSVMQVFARWRGKYERHLVARHAQMLQKTKFVEQNVALAKKLSNGELNEKIDVDQEDELGKALVDMQHNLLAAQVREKQERFVTGGLAQVNDILRKQYEDVESLCYEVLFLLIKYVGLNQGGVFILEEDETTGKGVLNLAAYYAYDRQKFLQKRFEAREGLPGQVLFEKETIQLKEVPENYVTIGSGLGDAKPRFVAAVPIKSNEEVVGVLEVAGFKALEAYEIGFLEKVCESFAATLIAAKSSESTKKLLQQSQEMTEQLRAQEEEMRQNMEELQATQEEVVRNKMETDARVAAIDQSGIGYIEFDLNGRIMSANRTFLDLMHYELDQIRGKDHEIFLGDSEELKKEAAEMWEGFRNGVAQPGTYQRYTQDGRTVYLNGAYSILYDTAGKPKGVINLVTDVTKNKKLLNRAQQQAKELKTKREEMQKAYDALTTSQLETEAKLTAIDEAGLLLAEFDLYGHVKKVNGGFERISGYTAEEAVGKHHRLLMPSDFMDWESYEAFWVNLRNGESFTNEVKRQHKNGKPIFMKASYIPVRGKDGNVTSILKLAVDITALKNLVKKSERHLADLEDQEQQFREMMEGLQGIQESEAKLQAALTEKEQELEALLKADAEKKRQIEELQAKLDAK